MVTLQQLRDTVFLVLGEDADPRVNPDGIVQQAGRHLFDMHPWNWRRRPSATINLVADQDYVELPSDFGFGILDAIDTSNLTTGIQLTTLDDIIKRRKISVSTPWDYHVALVYPAQSSVTQEPQAARLEIHPEPSSSSTGAITVAYRAGWVPLALPTSAANVPPTMDHMLHRVTRAFAHGAQDDWTHLRAMYEDPELIMQKRSDGASQPLGRMTGGRLSSDGVTSYQWNWSVTHPT